jgi:hypothetical protein
VEAKAWEAFSATLLLERSKLGLNELLDPGKYQPERDTAEDNQVREYREQQPT